MISVCPPQPYEPKRLGYQRFDSVVIFTGHCKTPIAIPGFARHKRVLCPHSDGCHPDRLRASKPPCTTLTSALSYTLDKPKWICFSITAFLELQLRGNNDGDDEDKKNENQTEKGGENKNKK